MTTSRKNLNVQKWVAAISILLLVVKFFAYAITHSVSILTDALESIVNVAASFIGLYSLYVASLPRDANHPYGHGKAEFLSAAVEGTMIGCAGAIILYKAINTLIAPVPLEKIDEGIWLVALTALVNLAMGYYCSTIGKRNNSMALKASGKHLMSDTISTAGIILGLVLLHYTGLQWIDGVVAIIFGIIIMYTGYKILRPSIAAIMDEADEDVLKTMVTVLNNNRQENWIDMHNLRVIKYGSILHVDAHLTVPWYLNVHEAHDEIEKVAALIKQQFGDSLELFVHTDGCLDFSCKICTKKDCTVRTCTFEKRVEWTLENISQNKKHTVS